MRLSDMAPARRRCDYPWPNECRINSAQDYSNFLFDLNLLRNPQCAPRRSRSSASPSSSTARTSCIHSRPPNRRHQNLINSGRSDYLQGTDSDRSLSYQASIRESLRDFTFAIDRQAAILKAALTKLEKIHCKTHHLQETCEGINKSVTQILFDQSVHKEERITDAAHVPDLSRLKVKEGSIVNTDLTL